MVAGAGLDLREGFSEIDVLGVGVICMVESITSTCVTMCYNLIKAKEQDVIIFVY